MPYRLLRRFKLSLLDRWLAPLMRLLGSTGVKPLHLTAASIPCGVAGVLLMFRNPALSAVLILTYFTLDFMDGALARVTGTETELGERADYLGDRVVAALFLVMIYIHTEEVLLPVTGLVLIVAVSLEDAGLIRR
ncbi:MAG: hypothetical protein GF416_01195 [Candidatus Altiarchaeales archaeon]|nr:hypothetical protein [Candidatus Altiarchaeales archaeon]MBD3415732.1 hypothetical protein [Candidatus Altiarchaeales archaeon]